MTARRSFPEEVRQRAYALWCSDGAYNAARTARLLQRELADDGPGPSAPTVRRWSAQEQWKAWVGENAPPLRGQNLERWTTMWRRQVVRQLDATVRVQRDHLLGAFDDPVAAEGALTEAACSMTRLLAQPGVRGLLRAAFREEEAAPVFFANRERQAWERLGQHKRRR